jgi:hypothetical protein
MTLLLVHAGATLFLAGLIWFVQVVHYPLFGSVGVDGFSVYSRLHSSRTTWVVAPPMLIELAAAVALLVVPGVPRWMSWTGAGLLAIVWLSTFLLQVPRHNELARGFDAAAHARLVATNWIRTFAWSARALLSLAMISR